MKRVLPLLLLAIVMCQCNSQSGQQNQPAQKSLSEQYPEKFKAEYIGERVLELCQKLCDCDPSKDNAFNNILTDEYGSVFKESLALPEGIDGDGPGAWLWIEFAGEPCTVYGVIDVNVTDNKAKIIWKNDDGEDEVALSFVDDEWLIDDIGNCSKKDLKDKILESRKYYQSIDWQELLLQLVERGYSKEDAVQASEGLKEQIETYFKNYPE